jgi:hypothetical protein
MNRNIKIIIGTVVILYIISVGIQLTGIDIL